jgi:hypothetical protein
MRDQLALSQTRQPLPPLHGLRDHPERDRAFLRSLGMQPEAMDRVAANSSETGSPPYQTGDPSQRHASQELPHLNLARFSLFSLRQHDRDHAIFH